MNDHREFPSLITMVGIVAVVVAVVILVFFGIGYLIGRLVL
jgi:preprotein translocase subunit SecE